MAALSRLAVLVPLTLFACAGDDGAPGPGGGGKADDVGGDGDATGFARCVGRAAAPAAPAGFRHLGSTLITRLGGPNHSAQDVIARPDRSATLVGKFTYGALAKDLEDEAVTVALDQCDGWHDLGATTTDRDGRIALEVPDALGPGVYEARFTVRGDGSTTRSYLWILPPGTRLVVTDIDGTMTESDAELFRQIFDGSHVPVAYPGAVELMAAHAERGWLPIYLTGRPHWLIAPSRAWLEDLDFAPGPLHVTDSTSEVLPTESGVAAYKRAYLDGLFAAGYDVDLAYGNATTDISAYLGAGLDPEVVWIIGKNAGHEGTHAVQGGWDARVGEVAALPVVSQPWQ